MKVSQIIHTVTKLLRLDIPAYCFVDVPNTELVLSEVSTNKSLATLLDSLNFVLDDLALDYSPNIEKGELECKNGFACTKMLNAPLLEVLKLTDNSGRNVKFRYTAGGLNCNTDGKLRLIYTTRYPQVGFLDEIEVSNQKIDQRVMAYGTAAEYCLLTSDYENMTIWDNRFKNCLATAQVKRCEKSLPQRRWC